MSLSVKKIIEKAIEQGFDIPSEGWRLSRCYPNADQKSNGACSWIIYNDKYFKQFLGFDLLSLCAKNPVFSTNQGATQNDIDITYAENPK